MSTLYNSPVLYDRSKSIVEAFSIKPRTRKFLLFTDNRGLLAAQTFVDLLDTTGAPYELFYLADKAETEERDFLPSLPKATTVLHDYVEAGLIYILREQKMGTRLYLAGRWKTAEMMYTLAAAAGFGEEELQVHIHDRKERSVFCPKCYSLTAIQEEKVTRCSHCGVMLDIGIHYSRVRKGYLGYPFV